MYTHHSDGEVVVDYVGRDVVHDARDRLGLVVLLVLHQDLPPVQHHGLALRHPLHHNTVQCNAEV